jgi:hypothetical protein
MNAAQRQEIVNIALKLSACLRSHGEPNFPDPSGLRADGRLRMAKSLGETGIDRNSPQFRSALQTCTRLNPVAHPGGDGS